MPRRFIGTQLSLNVSSGIAAALIGAAVTAVSYPLYLRFLGFERFGVWLTMSTVLTMAQLGSFGIARRLQLVAEESARGNVRAIEEHLSSAVWLLSLTGCAMLMGIILFSQEILSAFKITGPLADMAYRMLPWVGVLSVFVLIADALSATLLGLGRADAVNYLQAFSQIAGTLLSACLLWQGKGVESLLAGAACAAALFMGCIWLKIRGLQKIGIVLYFSQGTLRRLLSLGGWVLATSLLNLLLNPLNKVMLSQYAGVSALPLYELAWNGSMRVRGFIEAGLRALLPEISRLAADKSPSARSEIAALLWHSIRMAAGFGGVVFLAMIAFAPYLLQFWLREQYQPQLAAAMRLMLIASFFSLVGVPAFYTLLAIGLVRINFVGSALLPATNALFVAGACYLTGRVTLESVCSGVIAGMLALNVFMVWQVRRALADPAGATLRLREQPT